MKEKETSPIILGAIEEIKNLKLKDGFEVELNISKHELRVHVFMPNIIKGRTYKHTMLEQWIALRGYREDIYIQKALLTLGFVKTLAI